MEDIWQKYLDERDIKHYENVGFGKMDGMGNNMALVIVDVTYGFAGNSGETIEESVKKFATSCGENSWHSIPHIQKLLQTARQLHIPIYHTIIEGTKGVSNERVAIKGTFFDHPSMLEGERGTFIVEELKPVAGEVVISKKKASAFFGTPLVSYLMSHNIDTVIIAGCTTSGCIRASVVDAFSYNYQVIVPEECVFDRSYTSHAINLFDMQQKYADVVKVDELIDMLQVKKKQKV